MSQDIGNTRTCECRSGCCSFLGSSGGAFGCSGWLVVACGVEGQFAQELAGGGVDDADLEVLDEQDDAGSGVGSPDADVVESAVVPQGDRAGFVDAVVADSFVGNGVGGGAGQRFGHRVVERRRSGPVGQGPVRAAVVVLRDEDLEQRLELGDGGRLDRLGA